MKELSQEKRRSIMNMVVELMDGDLPPEKERKFDELDTYVCSVLEINIEDFPDHTI